MRAQQDERRLILNALTLRLSSTFDLKLHFWWLRHSLFIRHGKVGPLVQVQQKLGRQVGREIPDHLVVVRHSIDIPFTGHGDPIFRPFELALEIPKILISLEVRVVFGDRNQSA